MVRAYNEYFLDGSTAGSSLTYANDGPSKYTRRKGAKYDWLDVLFELWTFRIAPPKRVLYAFIYIIIVCTYVVADSIVKPIS